MAYNIEDPLFYQNIAERILSLETHLSEHKPIIISNDSIKELDIVTE